MRKKRCAGAHRRGGRANAAGAVATAHAPLARQQDEDEIEWVLGVTKRNERVMRIWDEFYGKALEDEMRIAREVTTQVA